MKFSQSTIETPVQTYVIEYDLGDRVYLVVRGEPIEGIVTGIGIRPGGHYFHVRWADGREEGHFAIELTTEAPI